MILIFSQQQMILSLKEASGKTTESTCYNNTDKPSMLSCTSEKLQITRIEVGGGSERAVSGRAKYSRDKRSAKSILQPFAMAGRAQLGHFYRYRISQE